MSKTFEIHILGQIQGVGFRPFIYRLAMEHTLPGMVYNNETGVVLLLNASKKAATQFLEKIHSQAPGIAIILSSTCKEVEYREFVGFRIQTSRKEGQVNLPLTPDFALCDTCLCEIQVPGNRRHGYPFTTCVACGPRYAITTDFPFERAHTSLARFPMCHTCMKEYANPEQRRFHSQTNTCPKCGVRLHFQGEKEGLIGTNTTEILDAVHHLLAEGKIVAIKNTSGYLLCCDAGNTEAILKLRQRKKRPAKPFALLYPNLEQVVSDFQPTAYEKEALLHTSAPIVLLARNKPLPHLSYDAIAPKLNQLGVMLPSSALLHLIMTRMNAPLIATSGNLHGSPVISDNQEAAVKLKNVADYWLHHNLPVTFPQDDSVVRLAGDQQLIIRRSRGMAPNFLTGSQNTEEPILAMGAQLKSTFTFVPNAHTYVSQYFGNLDNYEVYERYSGMLATYFSIFETTPKIILTDQHPHYQSTILGKTMAEEYGADMIAIQHHKAHFASVLEEHQLFQVTEKILGVVWDGTGYGEDQTIWGGEFFQYHQGQISRLSHFEYFDWIAGDKMAREPRISLLSLCPEQKREQLQSKFSTTEWKVFNRLLESNTLKTSSVGRLFDAVASVLNLADTTSYEGEAAMLLEAHAMQYEGSDFIDFSGPEPFTLLPTFRIIENIFEAISHQIPAPRIAASFIHTLARCIIRFANTKSIRIIACSGGVFQNALLINYIASLCQTNEILLKINRKLSGNDENISLGQLAYFQNINL